MHWHCNYWNNEFQYYFQTPPWRNRSKNIKRCNGFMHRRIQGQSRSNLAADNEPMAWRSIDGFFSARFEIYRWSVINLSLISYQSPYMFQFREIWDWNYIFPQTIIQIEAMNHKRLDQLERTKKFFVQSAREFISSIWILVSATWTFLKKPKCIAGCNDFYQWMLIKVLKRLKVKETVVFWWLVHLVPERVKLSRDAHRI